MAFLSNIDLVSLTFGVFNLLRLASYFPQIVAVIRDQNGATAISYSCWSIWVAANASTGVYAWLKLHDANLALISGFNALCCAIILSLAIYRRVSHRAFSAKTGVALAELAAAGARDGNELNEAKTANSHWPRQGPQP